MKKLSTENINRRYVQSRCVFWNPKKRECVKGRKCTTVLQKCFLSYMDINKSDEEKQRIAAIRKEYQDRYEKLAEETKQAVKNGV